MLGSQSPPYISTGKHGWQNSPLAGDLRRLDFVLSRRKQLGYHKVVFKHYRVQHSRVVFRITTWIEEEVWVALRLAVEIPFAASVARGTRGGGRGGRRAERDDTGHLVDDVFPTEVPAMIWLIKTSKEGDHHHRKATAKEGDVDNDWSNLRVG